MRWFIEWQNPVLKCTRVGHREGLEYRKGYRKPDFEKREYRYYVCVSVTEDREACLRCHAPLSAWTIRDRTGLTGYSWPKDMAERFDKEGELWQVSGFKAVTSSLRVPNSNSPQLNLFATGAIFICVPLGLILITLKALGVL